MSAYFLFEQESPEGERKSFIFQLNDGDKIAEARALLKDPESLKMHVEGKIISETAPYNPEWSFHLDPASINFFEMQVEVCDANLTYVEEHLQEIGGAFLPRRFWCPWSSRLMAEVPDPLK
ncbi:MULTISPECIES: hypothetical protein [Paraburkholderia]|uniref:BP74 N-terminal domain-containing protein n=1 Tax=Paraburkholderia madseniana TaxID=2599607 RepID=A0AAP5EZT0_9BURK|nr:MULTISPECIES: hypothetical protein [Paraburkholderia]MCX4151457.1 hypothetical protein [Paraburkholderia madseniana]MDN7154388.1 hypothetical protein [Paraburkholderia sp. WS6]MDQ6413270.1 hypothetical protein [Paraburkholderia madseniana]